MWQISTLQQLTCCWWARETHHYLSLYDSADLLGRHRWWQNQVLTDNFWSLLVWQYLPSLQECQKWKSDGRELTIGQVILIVDPRFPQSSWPVGTVTEIFPAADGRVRSATVQRPTLVLSSGWSLFLRSLRKVMAPQTVFLRMDNYPDRQLVRLCLKDCGGTNSFWGGTNV